MKLRDLLIKEIKQEVDCVEQWTKIELHFAVRHYDHLEALVDLGEIKLCGSTGGGFDKGQDPRASYTLKQRAMYVISQGHRL